MDVRHAEEAGGEDSRTFVTALARGLEVIRAFGPERPRLNLAEASKATGLPRATVRRCLHTLVVLGYVEADGRSFALTPKVLTLGHAYLSATPLPRIAQPYLERVSERSNESCSMSILDGDEIVYIARAFTKRIMSVGLSVGSRLPALYTSMGRVLLAGLSEAELARRLERSEPVAHTPYTRITPGSIAEAVADVRRQGYAILDQELEIGLRSVAVPIRNARGETLAAINISTQAGRVDLERLGGPLLEILQATARDISVFV
ncbi:transcriptional regulator, IclR family [Faunimonas pinastri]|uniref:Transcriptional regulator, IclR family n=1 Tax=Faunimonas pinastri TaxID=1855383 RepID=A0A1H9K6U4_9HYPH|nr:IclR family transcriptional regulator C-terminal domain-containing protein [Faunimonas pinastri]SEQ94936.1 transcriptional regulator, IclR family [Faunimonas pinastri]